MNVSGQNLRGSINQGFETSNRKLEGQFNVFKAYHNTKNRPGQYSKKKFSHHAISEYLDPSQKRMMAKRVSPDQSGDMFNSNWSGFKQK